MTDAGVGAMMYELVCNDCEFTTVVQGDIDELYEIIESHQDAKADHVSDHFVDFEALSV